ncbi:hypothetical protein GO755_00770 [Spirosoma sp. HMF4905]|uniref:Signal transduction histidine kinase internal region domain-containing protein n=1 Tax=Spirosoma arboris TaxID=2682092 RepID=A0A7K1S3Z3_9BACT|nr:sensor histidine kinase [Spirosoma arboris]MVM28544.1 hypothetical protein [Spirosoma arboris]
MKPINDSRLRWLGPVGLFFFGNLFFRPSFWVTAAPPDLIQSALVGLGAGWLFWQLNRWFIQQFQTRFPGLARTKHRLLMWLLLIPFSVNAAVFLRFSLHFLLGSRSAIWLGTVDYLASMGIQLFYHGVYFGIYEGWYVFSQWQTIQREKDEMTKIQWQTRFHSLKNQVNPHFLFNSLNSLSALIDESPGQAIQFVDELSKMYRYLLQSNERELVLLSTELSFIESYAHLLQTRYGTGICVQVTVSEQYMNHLLPPLTLQLLVENAVKHNIVMAGRPLLIEIDTTQTGQLRVRNNLQRKNVVVISNGIGLSNISAKYQMLTPNGISIQENNGHFTVLLPLLT